MTDHSHKSGSGFLPGFLWGVVIGGGALFLLGTPKGRKLLKSIREGGLESISELQELLEEEEPFEEIPAAKTKKTSRSKSSEELIPQPVDDIITTEPQEAPLQQLSSATRKIFRGVTRKN